MKHRGSVRARGGGGAEANVECGVRPVQQRGWPVLCDSINISHATKSNWMYHN